MVTPRDRSAASLVDRASRLIGGIEEVGVRALPVEEFAHLWPLLAMALLGVNDHLLKGSGLLPGWLTGKLSDFAGLFFFPLFVTAALDTGLYLAFRLSGGRTPDYSLSRAKLLFGIAFTAVLFVPLKLSDAWITLYIRAMHALDVFHLFGGFAVVRDPTDLVAVTMLPLVYLHGRRLVRRIPIGRLQVLSARAGRLPAEQRSAALAQSTRDIARLAAADGPRAALARFLDRFGAYLSQPDNERRRREASVGLREYRASLRGTA